MPGTCTVHVRVTVQYHDRKAQTLSLFFQDLDVFFEPGDWGTVPEMADYKGFFFAAPFACYGHCAVYQESWKPCSPPSGPYRVRARMYVFPKDRFCLLL